MCQQALFWFNLYLNPKKAYEMPVISLFDGAAEAHSHWVFMASVRATIRTDVVYLPYPSTQVKEKS